jgi:hypothetical protein
MAPPTSSALANGKHLMNGRHTKKASFSKSSNESLSDDMDSVSLDNESPSYNTKRKTSSPLMPAFMVSAPGKVIVYGEHAVVHGKVSFRVLVQAFAS